MAAVYLLHACPPVLLLAWLACCLEVVQCLHSGRHFPESQHPAPLGGGWERLGASEAAAEDYPLDIILAVAHDNSGMVEKAFHRVSDPRSADYGKYWSLDDSMTHALGAQTNAGRVTAWLKDISPGVHTDTTVSGDFVRVRRLPAQHAAEAFGMDLHPFRHKVSGVVRFAAASRALKYSVPSSLASAIDLVSGLHLPKVKEPRPTPRLHAQRRAKTLHNRLQEGGQVEVTVVEARSRAFQVHVTVKLDKDFVSQVCHRAASLNGAQCRTDKGGAGALSAFEAIATPVRLDDSRTLYHPLNLTTESPDILDCSTDDNVLYTCVFPLGPSLYLTNFISTRLEVRAMFVDGSVGKWGKYRRLAYPTQSMTVDALRQLYGVPSGYRYTHPRGHNSLGATQGIMAFLNVSSTEADAHQFHVAMGMRAQPAVKFVGPPGLPNVEGSIDIQWIQGMGNNVPTTYWTFPGGRNAHEPFLEWLLEVANTTAPPQVQSVSYGENEADYSVEYTQRCNLEFMKMGLRGISVLIATGDTGVQGAAQPGGSPAQCAPFVPVWPASSPYVTAVGATQFSTHSSEVCDVEQVFAMGTNSSVPFACPELQIGEIVCSVQRGAMITGGGGFSNRFPRPKYQEAAVKEYLHHPHGRFNFSQFNRTGRGYPDISAVGENVPIFIGGQLVMVGGTSSSSPIVAGLISLLNGERLRAGQPVLGFLNPLLYAMHEAAPEIVQDVRVGNNSGGNLLLPPELDVDCSEGFHALPGWDATTGLGSPNFREMLKVLIPPHERSKSLWRQAQSEGSPQVDSSPRAEYI